MTQYSDEFKDNIIKQMLPSISKSVRQLHNETGVSEQTLFKWKKQAKSSGLGAPSGNGTSNDKGTFRDQGKSHHFGKNIFPKRK